MAMLRGGRLLLLARNAWPRAAPARERALWNESLNEREEKRSESFYDSTVERYAALPIRTLTLEQVCVSFGLDTGAICRAAN
jgi:hypothetical protein